MVLELHADWVDMASKSPGRFCGTANFTCRSSIPAGALEAYGLRTLGGVLRSEE